MAKARPSPTAHRNNLLGRLPPGKYRRLLARLEPVTFEVDQVLHTARKPMRYAYFPTRGALSAVTDMGGRGAIEVGTMGSEGMAGSTAFLGVPVSPHKVIVQVAGEGVRVEATVLARASRPDGPLREVLVRYHTFFVAQICQSAACNGLHSVAQRCCRWLLMTHDRAQGTDFRLTHEYLGLMLGVRRQSVSLVLKPLQDRGLIRYSRGTFSVTDRPGMEAASCSCYRWVREEYDRLLG